MAGLAGKRGAPRDLPATAAPELRRGGVAAALGELERRHTEGVTSEKTCQIRIPSDFPYADN